MKIDDVRNSGASAWEVTAGLDGVSARAGLPFRQADFNSLPEALDYAALSDSRLNFHNVRGQCEHSLTYGEVREQALDLAKRLRGLGLERGQHIGIVAEQHPEFIVTFYACQYGGFVAVPLPVVSGLGGRRGYELQLARIFENSDIQAILTPDSLRGTFLEVAAALSPERILTVAELLERTPSSEPMVPLGPDEISHIQFSSGSTRFPLGVEISQQALMANARAIAVHGLKMTAADRVVSWLPFYHDMGLVGQCIVPATCQISVDFLHPADFSRRPLQWLRLISESGGTMSFSPDFGYEVCARLGLKEIPPNLDLSRWRAAGIGGDMVRPHVLEQFAGVFAACGFKKEAFIPSYGLAEATLAFSFESPQAGVLADRVDKTILANEGRAVPAPLSDSGAMPARTFASCGIPMPGYQVEIRGEGGRVLPERHVGEVFISGPSLMTGYYKQPEVTRRCIGEDGWLNTGDMGYLVGERLFITGRHKDMIIVKGRNIWPHDLEWHVERDVPGLTGRSCAAFAHQTPDGEEIAVILVQCRKSELDQREQLRKEVAAAISRNAGIVCQVELIPYRSLPFTTSGKLIRSKARQNWLDGIYDMDDTPADGD